MQGHMVVNDRVTVALTANKQLTTDKVRVTVKVSIRLSDKDVNVRDRLSAVLRGIADVEWSLKDIKRITDMNEERIDAVAVARMQEKELSGTMLRAREAERPGLTCAVTDVSYAPTLRDQDAAYEELRGQLYQMAVDEAKKLQEIMPLQGTDDRQDKRWRVSEFTIIGAGGVNTANIGKASLAMMSTATSYSNSFGGGDDGLDVTQNVTLSAEVVLSRVAFST